MVQGIGDVIVCPLIFRGCLSAGMLRWPVRPVTKKLPLGISEFFKPFFLASIAPIALFVMSLILGLLAGSRKLGSPRFSSADFSGSVPNPKSCQCVILRGVQNTDVPAITCSPRLPILGIGFSISRLHTWALPLGLLLPLGPDGEADGFDVSEAVFEAEGLLDGSGVGFMSLPMVIVGQLGTGGFGGGGYIPGLMKPQSRKLASPGGQNQQWTRMGTIAEG